MRKITRIGAAGSCVLALALAVTACSGGGTPTNTAPPATAAATAGAVVPGSTLIAYTGQVGNFTAANFNPFNQTGSFLQPTQGAIYEPLFYYNIAQAQDPVPVLGTSFSWNDDGTVLTVKVRENVKFNDGSAMTADDVVYSMNLISHNPALNTSGQVWETAKVDDTTVTLTFPKSAFTLEAQILGREPIVPQAVWSSISDPAAGLNSTPVGTGPYMLDQYSPQAITLKVNPYYWGTGAEAPAVESIRYISLASNEAAQTALLQGQVDWMGSFWPGLDASIKGTNGQLGYVNTPQATTSLFACANADLGCKGPQTDPAVRLAMYYAMDRTQLNTQALEGFGKPASPTLLLNWVNKDQITDPSYMEVPQTPDVAKAKSLLEGAGWAMGSDGYYAKGGKTLELTVTDVSGWSDYNTACQLLAGQFKTAGIKLVVNHVAQNQWTQAEVSGDYQLSLNSVNMGASSDPYNQYNAYLNSKNTAKAGTAASTNTTRFSNPDVDKAIQTLASTNDPATKTAQYKTIQDILIKDMPIIPIYVNQAVTEFSNARITGWPAEGNLYVFPEPWGGNWGTGILLKTVRPVAK